MTSTTWTAVCLTLGMMIGVLHADPATTTSAPDLNPAMAALARQDGGSVDLTGAATTPGAARLDSLVAQWRASGRKLWVLRVPESQDLAKVLDQLGGRVAPGERDLVVVASSNGVRARVPALAGHTSVIDTAFEASRRELAVDLPGGLVTFINRVEEGREQRETLLRRMSLLAGIVILGGGLYALRRWGLLRVSQARWEREDRAKRDQLVARCQEKLHKLSSAPSGSRAARDYDELYARFKLLLALSPLEAIPGLEPLLEQLEKAAAPEVTR